MNTNDIKCVCIMYRYKKNIHIRNPENLLRNLCEIELGMPREKQRAWTRTVGWYIYYNSEMIISDYREFTKRRT